ncbi:hypothetical protein [Streptomyces niveus]|uniref:hypothetical protein n=1 Tax=Streptomyces niveus TaxID=193462 RepID=UPI003436186C
MTLVEPSTAPERQSPGPGRPAHLIDSAVQFVTDGERDPLQSHLRVDPFQRVVEFEEPGTHEIAVLGVGVELLAGDLREVAETEPVDERQIDLEDRPDHSAGEWLSPRQIHGPAMLRHEVDRPIAE